MHSAEARAECGDRSATQADGRPAANNSNHYFSRQSLQNTGKQDNLSKHFAPRRQPSFPLSAMASLYN